MRHLAGMTNEDDSLINGQIQHVQIQHAHHEVSLTKACACSVWRVLLLLLASRCQSWGGGWGAPLRWALHRQGSWECQGQWGAEDV